MNTSFFLAAAGTAPSAYYAYQHSDGVGKFIVIFLLVMSAVTWTIMADKGMALRRSRRLSERFLRRFDENSGSIVQLARETNDSPVAAVYAEGITQLLAFYEEAAPGSSAIAGLRTGTRFNSGNPRPVAPVKLTSAQLNAIEAVLENEISEQIMQLDTRIGFLGTAVSVSPFFGLFGTVWGVMMAFCGIAMAGKSDFAALAPGVAGALLTTVAGLVVAIPSLIGYNLLNANIRQQTTQMDNFAESFMVKVKLEQLESNSEANGTPDME